MRSTAWRLLVALALLLAACGGNGGSIEAVSPLPETTPDEMAALLAAAPDPVVLNVWASWCLPCRSEAPLLERAAAQFGDRVDFVGVNVRDRQSTARAFIAEFATDGVSALDQYFDPGGVVPPSLGGSTGVPLTFFFAAGGELVHLHSGVIDERTLALQVDEILTRSG